MAGTREPNSPKKEPFRASSGKGHVSAWSLLVWMASNPYTELGPFGMRGSWQQAFGSDRKRCKQTLQICVFLKMEKPFGWSVAETNR